MPVFHLSLHRLVFATNSTLQFLFLFEKYYKAHIGTKLAYKTKVSPRCAAVVIRRPRDAEEL